MAKFKRAASVMVDYDNRSTVPAVVINFKALAKVIFPGVRWAQIYYVPSASGKGLHLWVTARNRKYLNPFKIILMQCLLGSDLGRETANVFRVGQGIREWNRLFDTGRIQLSFQKRKGGRK